MENRPNADSGRVENTSYDGVGRRPTTEYGRTTRVLSTVDYL